MMLPTKTNALSAMACRKGPSIRLSVRRDSTKKRSAEYRIPYRHII